MAIKDYGPVTAYSMAVEAGFTGTFQEWVQAISGNVDSTLSGSSTNPIQNQAVYNAISDLKSSINYVTPEMFGAVGDGETDDTEAVKEACESGYACILTKTYKIGNETIYPSKNIVSFGAKIVPFGTETIFDFRKTITPVTYDNSSEKVKLANTTDESYVQKHLYIETDATIYSSRKYGASVYVDSTGRYSTELAYINSGNIDIYTLPIANIDFGDLTVDYSEYDDDYPTLVAVNGINVNIHDIHIIGGEKFTPTSDNNAVIYIDLAYNVKCSNITCDKWGVSSRSSYVLAIMRTGEITVERFMGFAEWHPFASSRITNIRFIDCNTSTYDCHNCCTGYFDLVRCTGYSVQVAFVGGGIHCEDCYFPYPEVSSAAIRSRSSDGKCGIYGVIELKNCNFKTLLLVELNNNSTLDFTPTNDTMKLAEIIVDGGKLYSMRADLGIHQTITYKNLKEFPDSNNAWMIRSGKKMNVINCSSSVGRIRASGDAFIEGCDISDKLISPVTVDNEKCSLRVYNSKFYSFSSSAPVKNAIVLNNVITRDTNISMTLTADDYLLMDYNKLIGSAASTYKSQWNGIDS